MKFNIFVYLFNILNCIYGLLVQPVEMEGNEEISVFYQNFNHRRLTCLTARRSAPDAALNKP